MEDYFETFRLNLKFYREEKKISQSQLAIGADCTNGLIGQIESGTTKPSFDRIVNIASALGVHPADLFLRNASQSRQNVRDFFEKDIMQLVEKRFPAIQNE